MLTFFASSPAGGWQPVALKQSYSCIRTSDSLRFDCIAHLVIQI